MSLAEIVTALRPVVKAVTGIEACYPRIPEIKPPEELFTVIESGLSTRTAAGADLERVVYPINVYVLTKRSGRLWEEQDLVLPYVDLLPEALRNAYTLGGLTYGTEYDDPSTEMVAVPIDDQSYIGIVVHLRYKQKQTVAYSG